ncbi:hypothetical protein M8J77_018741 [Diaphorina citri]|nr:hypothetical protein M8J77_018741 [Diaphorina citri]
MSEVGISQEKSPSKRLKMSDKEFSPPVEMMVNDFDDERTLDEEEAMETSEDHQAELSSLQKERDMPLDELLAMYGYNEHNNERSPSHGSEQETASVKEHGADADAHITDPLAPPVSDPLMLDEEIEDDDEEEEEEEKQPVSQLAKLYEEGCSTSSKETALSKALEEDDDEYNFFDEHPDDDDDDPKKTIMVGSEYQAWIPEGMCKYGDILPYENDDKLLWDPNHNLVTVDLVETYLKKSHEMFINGAGDCLPMGSHSRDDEQALYLLLQCGYNTEEALRRASMQSVPNPDTTSMWSEEECKNFESGLRMYGKNFYQIHQNKVKTRNVGEIVQFYYLWKKTERHDVFANKARLEKKKYSLHPGITDYMDRFLDEQEGSINPPASPNVYLMSESSKRQRNSSLGNKTTPPEETKTDKEGATSTPAAQQPANTPQSLPQTQTTPTSSAEEKT